MAVTSILPTHQTTGNMALYRPREAAAQLGIAPTTLRLWSTQFATLLSTSARKEEGRRAAAHRRYTADDVRLLSRVKHLLADGLTYAEVQRRLSEDSGEGRVNDTDDGTIGSLSGLSQLRERLPQLPRQQYRLAQALLKTPEMIMFGSVRELALALHINNATIIRFAQSLGYSGYQALQTAVRQTYLPRAGLQAPRDSTARSNPSSAVTATLAQHTANLTLAEQHLHEADLDQICDLLITARRVLVCATGTPIVPATLLIRLLRHVGLRGELVAPSGVDRAIALYDVGPGDVIIGMGFWLTFSNVVKTLALGRRLGARTIAITGSPTSPLADVADFLLIAPAQGTAISFSAVATVAVVEALIAHIAGQRPQRTADIEQTLHDLYLQEDLLAPLLTPSQEQNK
ncbi:MAG: MerR family transcriptional regulator [Thermomicrobiales bacterium]